jgi:hypothetical protein
MSTIPSRWWVVLCAGSATAGGTMLLACSSQHESAASADGGGDAGVDAPVSCDGGIYVGHVSGKLLDTDGNVPSVKGMSICGNACIVGDLAPDGTFSIAPRFCYAYLPDGAAGYPVPVFLYHGEPQYADLAVNFLPQGPQWVDDASIDYTMFTVATANLAKVTYDPLHPTPVALSDGNGFSLAADAGAIVMPIGQTQVMAGPVDLTHFPLGPDAGGATLTALYVVVPVGTKVNPPATVRFPNVAKLSAGAMVDLLAIGDLPTVGAVAPGTLGVIGTGRVTSDGASVESVPGTDTDTGLVMLGWIGYRPKQ